MNQKETFILELSNDEISKVKDFLGKQNIELIGDKNPCYERIIDQEQKKIREKYNCESVNQKKILGDIILYGTPFEKIVAETDIILSKYYDEDYDEQIKIKYDTHHQINISGKDLFQLIRFDSSLGDEISIEQLIELRMLRIYDDVLEIDNKHFINRNESEKQIRKIKTINL